MTQRMYTSFNVCCKTHMGRLKVWVDGSHVGIVPMAMTRLGRGVTRCHSRVLRIAGELNGNTKKHKQTEHKTCHADARRDCTAHTHTHRQPQTMYINSVQGHVLHNQQAQTQ